MALKSLAWTLASFSPWIVYWALPAPLGARLLAGLAVSSAPVLAGILYGLPNTLNVFTLLFFSAYTPVAFTAPGLAASYAAPLSYLALSAAAAYTLATEKPFTLEFAKLSYPEPYWSDPTFQYVNSLLTGIWLIVFIVAAALSALGGWLSLLSYAFLGLGGAASYTLPSLLVMRRLRREYGGLPDWRVEGRDIVVVGAGVGGLACAALLSRNGYRVTVLEQHYAVGGYCSSFRRGGFVFDVGVESISGLWERGPVRLLLEELGVEWKSLFIETQEAYVVDGEWIRIPRGLEGVVGALAERFPWEADAIRAFFKEAAEVLREIYADVDEYGVPLNAPLIYRLYGWRTLMDYPRKRPRLISWMRMSYKEVLDRYFSDEKLKRLLSVLTAYLGTRPEETPAASMATILSYYIYGGYYPKGGSQAFPELLAGIVRESGGRVLLGHRVERIVVEDGRVKGVVARGKFFPASAVVFAANVKQLPRLAPGLPRCFVEEIERLQPSATAFMLYLGVEERLGGYPPLIKDLDQGVGVSIPSGIDSSLAPRGCSTVHVVKLLSPEMYDYFTVGEPLYSERKAEYAETLRRAVEKLVPETRSAVVVDAATPRTFEKYTLNYKGAIYAFDQSLGAQPRPYFKTPVVGLYLAGASTFPGGGVEAAVISGVIAARDIMGWRKRRMSQKTSGG